MFGTGWKRATATIFSHRLAVSALASLLWLCSGAAPASASSPGQLFAFGSNEFGQLGNTTNLLTGAANPLPTPVVLPGQNGPVTQIAGGNEHSLVVTATGQLYAFGENQFGQLGTTTNSGTGKANPTPTLVSLPSGSPPVTEVAAGTYFSLALTSSGQLYGFGENQDGQLGNATNNHSTAANPTPTLVSLPGAGGPVTAVAAGAYFSLAITSTGQLFAFGENDRGQLGMPTNSGTNTPNPTPTLVSLPSGSGAVTEIAAGYDHALVLTSSGQLYGFGENQFGQLGTTVDNGSSAANPGPELVSLPGADGPVTQIGAGGEHSLVVTSSGQLYAFGENRFGQLGTTVNNGSYAANPTPTAVSLPGAIGPVIRVAGGIDSSLAVTATGQLFAFGENRYGQLGDTNGSGIYEGENPTPTLADLPAGTAIGAVAGGPLADHTLAVTGTDPGGSTTSPLTISGSAGPPAPSPVVNAPHCRVPSLRGKHVKAAKKKLKAADCKLGKVKKQRGATAKGGRVVEQKPGPGKRLAAGAKVVLTLGNGAVA